MKHYLRPSLTMLALLVSIIVAFTAYTTHQKATRTIRQANPPLKKLPHMWTDDKSSDDDEQYFLLHFNPELKRSNPSHSETDSLFYADTEFNEMITACGKLNDIQYLDIYPAIPPGDTIALLFVPKNSAYQPLAWYYLTPVTAVSSGTVNIVSATDAENWIKSFNNRIRSLNNELNSNDLTNYKYCTKDPANFSNTIYLHHPYSDFTELFDEFDYQKNQYGKKMSGIKAFLAARPDKGAELYKASKRFYVLFEFTDEDDINHPHRRFRIPRDSRDYQGPSFPILGDCAPPRLRKDSFGGNNNGQMCPPTCNP